MFPASLWKEPEQHSYTPPHRFKSFRLAEFYFFSNRRMFFTYSPMLRLLSSVGVCVLGIREQERPGLKRVKRITKIAHTHTQDHINMHRQSCLLHFSIWSFQWAVEAKSQQSQSTGKIIISATTQAEIESIILCGSANILFVMLLRKKLKHFTQAHSE